MPHTGARAVGWGVRGKGAYSLFLNRLDSLSLFPITLRVWFFCLFIVLL